MTIAAGILLPHTGQLVIGADSQETYTDAKVRGDKIMVLCRIKAGSIGTVVFTGAGAAGYLDSLGQNVLATFHDKTDLVGNALKAAIEDDVVKFYKAHVFPFKETWAKNDGLNISSLIAWQRNGNQAILSNTNTAVSERPNFHAVGTGSVVALSILRELYNWRMDLEGAARLLAYVIYRAKQHDPSCGMETEIVCLSDGNFMTVPQDIVNTWDQQFERFTNANAAMMRRALGVVRQHPDDPIPLERQREQEAKALDVPWEPLPDVFKRRWNALPVQVVRQDSRPSTASESDPTPSQE